MFTFKPLTSCRGTFFLTNKQGTFWTAPHHTLLQLVREREGGSPLGEL
ncbi:unnamed protein product [Ixodes pacificus]